MTRTGAIAALLVLAGLAHGQDEPLEGPSVERPDRWSSFLPLMADEAYERGHELPLPFGVGFNIISMQREIEVKEVRAGFGELNDVTDLVAVDTKTQVNTLIVRGDAWILPFLDVYVMGGYLENVADLDVAFTVPGPGTNTTNVAISTDLDQSGALFGGGITLAAGYDDFFLMTDATYSRTELDGVLDESIQVFIYSARAGWNGMVDQTPLRVWLGGMYWDSERVVKGSVGSIKFEVLQGPVDPFNLTLGTNVELGGNVDLVGEYAFNFDDLHMLTLGTAYRF